MTEQTQNVKQGAVIGGWICFGLGLAIMLYSLWLVPVYGALLFAAFVLSIVAMSQKRIAGGLALLLCCVIFGPGLWLYLSLTKSARALNKAADYIEQDNLKHGIGIRTRGTPAPPSTPFATIPTASTAVSSPQAQNQSNKDDDVAGIYRDRLESVDASQIAIAASKVFDRSVLKDPVPTFSADGMNVLYARKPADRVEVVAKYLPSLKETIRFSPAATPYRLIWGPSPEKIAYLDTNGHLHIVETATSRDVELPIRNFPSGMPSNVVWRDATSMIWTNAAFGPPKKNVLDLNTLQIDVEDLPKDPATRQQRMTELQPGPRQHPKCTVVPYTVHGDDSKQTYLLVGDRTVPNAHVLSTDFFDEYRSELNVSADLRHVLVTTNDTTTIYYLCEKPRPTVTYRLAIDPSKFLNARDYAEFVRRTSSKETFNANVYSPQSNPLNGNLIGPDKRGYKGKLRITEWRGTSALALPSLEITSFREGDVAAEITSDDGTRHGKSWIWDRWWSVLTAADKEIAKVQIDASPQSPLDEADQRKAAGSPPEVPASKPPNEPHRDEIAVSQSEAGIQHNALEQTALPSERFPETRMRSLTSNDVKDWSPTKLRYAINEMFARHGAEFGDKQITKWFSQFAWYKPAAGSTFDDIETSLTDIERQNLLLLGAYRNAKRDALKVPQPVGRNQRQRQRDNRSKQNDTQPNPVVERLLESVLQGIQQGLENH